MIQFLIKSLCVSLGVLSWLIGPEARGAQGGEVGLASNIGLPRLRATPGNRALVLPGTQVRVDGLAASQAENTRKGRKNGTDFVDVPARTIWNRALRGSDSQSVSVLLLGSEGTILEVGGARVGLAACMAEGSLQLMYDDAGGGTPTWKGLGIYSSIESYDGRAFSALPIITVILSPKTATWHIYAGTRLVAYDLPLLPGLGGKVTLNAGRDGAWVYGLVQSDENPLCEDANENGIDDVFEKMRLDGLILPKGATSAERQELAAQWKHAQRTTMRSPGLSYGRPLPDR